MGNAAGKSKFTKEELAAMKPAERQGHQLYAQGEAKLKKMFGDKDEAKELFEKAAVQFKLAKLPDESAKCYGRMADVCNMDKDDTGAARAYVEGGETLINQGKNPEGGSNLIRKAVEIYKNLGKFDRAGKQLLKVAELMEKDGEAQLALSLYEEAGEMYEMDAHGKSSIRKCKEKVAMLSATLDKLSEASELFTEIGKLCLEKNISKFHAKGFFFKAILCQLARGDAIGAKEAWEEATMSDYSFEASSEGKFMKVIMEALSEKDIDKFQQTLRARNEVTPFDPWHTTLLLKVKNIIKPTNDEFDDLANETPDMKGGDAAEEMDDLA